MKLNLSPQCRWPLILVYYFLTLNSWSLWKSSAYKLHVSNQVIFLSCLFLSLIELSTESLKSPGESPAGRCVSIGTARYLLVQSHYLVTFPTRNSSQRAGKPHNVPGWWRKESTSCVIRARQSLKCILWNDTKGFLHNKTHSPGYTVINSVS